MHERITITVDAPSYRAIKRIQETTGASVSYLVRRAIAEYLNRRGAEKPRRVTKSKA